MLVAQNSLAPVCPVPLTVRGTDSVRSRLRDRFGVEAAVGGFPDGGFLRLSHAVYTSDDDIERLRDAVLELVV